MQGREVSPEFVSEIISAAEISGLDCSNSGGPVITVGDTLIFPGCIARFIFRNNTKGTHTAEVVRDVELVVKGSQITIPKQPVQGGAGGNPIISVQFLDGAGDPIGKPVKLGRCNQI